MFANLNTDDLEKSEDRLGGGFKALETDIHIMTIKALYAGQSDGGALSLNLIADVNGNEYRETFWITNKKKENFFYSKDEKDKMAKDPTYKGKKAPLPGFTVADDICLIATDLPLAQQKTEEKVIKLYDFDAKKELPKTVDMITAAIGKKIALGVLKVLENKNELVGNEYVPTAEERELNTTDKVFHPEQKITVAEARDGQTEAKFWDSWLDRNKGKIRDKRTIKDGAGGAPRGAAPTAGGSAAAAPRKSLFNK